VLTVLTAQTVDSQSTLASVSSAAAENPQSPSAAAILHVSTKTVNSNSTASLREAFEDVLSAPLCPRRRGVKGRGASNARMSFSAVNSPDCYEVTLRLNLSPQLTSVTAETW